MDLDYNISSLPNFLFSFLVFGFEESLTIFILGQGSVHLRLWVQVAGRPEGGLSDQRPVVRGSAQVQQVVRLDIWIYYDTFYEPLRVS